MKAFTLLFCLFTLCVGKLAGVTIIPYPNPLEVESLLTSENISWSVTGQTGYPSTATPELVMNTGQSIPIEADHIWSTPEQIRVSYSGAGNLSASAGSTELMGQPLDGFVALLIRVGDSSFFSNNTQLTDIMINGQPIRNMFADDGNTFVQNNDWALVLLDGEDTFDFDATFHRGALSTGTESNFGIYGLRNVPEPSPSILALLSIGVALSRRNKR